MNVIIAGGYVAKALGLTTKFGENIVDKFRNNTKTYSGDIDIFMGNSVYKRILELRRAQAVMTIYDDDIDFGKLRMYSRSSYFGREVAEVANIPYNETRTKKKNIYLFFQRACKICCFKMRPYNTATHPSVKAITANDALMQLPDWLKALLKYFWGKK